MKKTLLPAYFYLIVQFAFSIPCLAQSGVQVCATYPCNGHPIHNCQIEVTLESSSPGLPPLTFSGVSDATGCITALEGIPIDSNANIAVSIYYDGNPLNGVNTLDLTLISRHILGLEPLDSPYKIIAADANKSGSITSFDIAELRGLILGLYPTLPNNTSWRFIDSSFAFSNPANPFQTAFPENATIQVDLHQTFYGVKIGDVDCSALEFFTPPNEAALTIPDLYVEANDVVEVPVSFLQVNQNYGFQFGLQFDPAQIQVLEVIPTIGTLSNFGVFADRVNVSWSEAMSVHTFLPNQPLYKLRVKALTPLHLADAFNIATEALPAQAYPDLDNNDLVSLRLQFAMVPTNEPNAAQTIFDPTPNPTTAGIQIPIQLEQSATVVIELIDVMGRLMYHQEKTSGSGAQLLELPANVFPQPGVYIWRVQAGEVSRSGKIVRQ